jgi:hypothetical protein
LRDAESVTDTVKDAEIEIIVPADGFAEWYDTRTGRVIERIPVKATGRNPYADSLRSQAGDYRYATLKAPPFVTDIALRVTP